MQAVERVPQRILVVDDEPALLRLVVRYLTRLGYEVTPLESAEEAWIQVQTTPEVFSAMLVDLTLPGMGGFELARRILESSPNARVIATSGYPMDLQSLEIAAPGRISFLQKPFRPEMLAAILQVSEPPATKGKV